MTRFLSLACAIAFALAAAAPHATAGAPGGKRGPKARAPKGQEGENEEEEEGGTVYVLEDSDAVILRDGTRIKGTILCAGQAAVTILTPDGEKTIPREKIERVIKNADAGFPKKFKAEPNDGHKYLVEAPPDEYNPDDEGGPAPKRPKAKPKARPKANPKTKRTPRTPGKRTPKAQPGKPTLPNLPNLPNLPGGLPNLRNLPNLPNLPGGLPKDPAKLRALLQRLRKEGKLDQLLKDPRASDLLRKAMRQR